jgi:D-aminopeptidase
MGYWVCGVQGVPSLAAGGDAQAVNELSQHLRNFIMATLHETTARVAAKSMRDVVGLSHVTAYTLPAVAKGGEDAHPNADPAGIE